MVSNTYNRYLWLISTLLDNKKLSFKQLCDKWANSSFSDGVPLNKRTFHKHCEAVEQMFGVDIECNNSYQYFIKDNSVFNNDYVRRWLINSFNTSFAIKESKKINARIVFEDIPSGTEFLKTIISSMVQNKILSICYQTFYGDKPQTFTLRPYCLKQYRQRWYLLAFCNERNALRHYSLDRIKSMDITDSSFVYPDDFNPETYYKNSIGIWVDDTLDPEIVVIRAYGEQVKYLRTLPLHSSQVEIFKCEGYSDFEYNICITKVLEYELLRYGNSVEVLEPKKLRESMITNIKDMLNRYKN